MTSSRPRNADGKHDRHALSGGRGEGDEPADALIAGMQVRGRPVSRTQLARWHRTGYLPAPRRVALGRGRGTVSIYPPGTREQLEALCDFLSHERNLKRVGWRMWWSGYAVPSDFARDLLSEVADAWEQLVALLRPESPHHGISHDADEPTAHAKYLDDTDEAEEADEEEDLSEQAWEALDESPTTRLSHAWVRRVRKRVGRARFPTFMRIMLQMMAGSFSHFAITADDVHTDDETSDVPDIAVLTKAIGLDRIERFVPEYPVAETTENLEAWTRAFSTIVRSAHPREIATVITDSELEQARREVRMLEEAVLAWEDLARHWFDPRQADALLEPLRLVSAARPEDMAGAVLVWHAARSAGYGPAIDAFILMGQQMLVAQQMADIQGQWERTANDRDTSPEMTVGANDLDRFDEDSDEQ